MADGIRQLDGLRIGVVGAGVGGLGAAWLLSQRHHVTLLEQADYLGGHSHTVDVRLDGATVPVDTGFIVYNELNYPNLTQLFAHLAVASAPGDMSFAVSLHGGRWNMPALTWPVYWPSRPTCCVRASGACSLTCDVFTPVPPGIGRKRRVTA